MPLTLLVSDREFNDVNLPAIHANTQGAIYAPHGCAAYSYGFVTFHAGSTDAHRSSRRLVIQDFGAAVTSAAELIDLVERRRAAARSAQQKAAPENGLLRAVGVSSAGYEQMGFSGGFAQAYTQGFAHRAGDIGAPAVQEWTDGLWANRPRYHLVILLAARDTGKQTAKEVLDAAKAAETVRFSNVGTIDWQDGYVDRTAQGRAKEHFGFADGIGQPFFFDSPDRAPAHTRKFPGDPQASLGMVLLQERFPAENVPLQFGSFSAFLKIRQNVDLFHAQATALTAALGKAPSPGADRISAAMMIGREHDGTPLNHSGADLNDVDATQRDTTWPYCSHTRKMDWRNAPARRILRRGVLYAETAASKGLLFHSFQADLAMQFEIMLGSWAYSGHHPEPNAGVDPILGRPGSPAQQWPKPGGGHAACPVSGSTVIEGGEYFYFPSIPSLRQFDSVPRTWPQ